MATIATHESLAAMGDLVSKLVEKHGKKNKQILDGDFSARKRRKVDQKSKKELSEKRKAKRELLEMGRINSSNTDIVNERRLSKIATKGIIQLFNAVKQHQKDVDSKLKKVKTEAQRDKIHQSITTGSFLDLVRPKSNPSAEKSDEDKKWNVLKDDFMMNNKVKDWKKTVDDNEEEEESDGSIDGDVESDESDGDSNDSNCSSD